MTVFNTLSSILPPGRLLTEEPMAKHTTFRIGGPAEIFAAPQTRDELIQIIRICDETAAPCLIIGDGANMLVSDKGIRGVVVQTSNINSIEIENDTLTADTGARLAKISDAACKAGLTGLEFACGIPGTVGGAVYMNAGAYGREIKDVCESVTVYDRENEPGAASIKVLSNADMQFGYRQSALQSNPRYVALGAAFKLTYGKTETIRAEMDVLLAKRKESQPLEYPSAGSVFKRPPGHFAGKLIQDAGLMGFLIGGAQVSTKHAGFIVNKGGATAEDVLKLIEHIQKTVSDKFNVNLEPEIKVIL